MKQKHKPTNNNLMVFQNTKIFFSRLPDFDEPVVPAVPKTRTAFKRYMVSAPTAFKTRTSEPECECHVCRTCTRDKSCHCCNCDPHIGGNSCPCPCCESDRQHAERQNHFYDRHYS